jgi:hypothetical protein
MMRCRLLCCVAFHLGSRFCVLRLLLFWVLRGSTLNQWSRIIQEGGSIAGSNESISRTWSKSCPTRFQRVNLCNLAVMFSKQIITPHLLFDATS